MCFVLLVVLQLLLGCGGGGSGTLSGGGGTPSRFRGTWLTQFYDADVNLAVVRFSVDSNGRVAGNGWIVRPDEFEQQEVSGAIGASGSVNLNVLQGDGFTVQMSGSARIDGTVLQLDLRDKNNGILTFHCRPPRDPSGLAGSYTGTLAYRNRSVPVQLTLNQSGELSGGVEVDGQIIHFGAWLATDNLVAGYFENRGVFFGNEMTYANGTLEFTLEELHWLEGPGQLLTGPAVITVNTSDAP
jgi:hypothetical protein